MKLKDKKIMSNKDSTETGELVWTKKFKPKHLKVGTEVKRRDGFKTSIEYIDADGPVTHGAGHSDRRCHRHDGSHFFGESEFDIVEILKAKKPKTKKPLDLRTAVVGSRITFSSGQKAVVDGVGFDGSDATFIAHDHLEVKAGWYCNISGERVGDADAPHIIKLKQPKTDSE